MDRGNVIFTKISKLNTFALLVKSNELLKIYVEKIINKKCKSLRFGTEFNSEVLNVLFTSLKYMGFSEKFDKAVYNHFDKKVLRKHIYDLGGMESINEQCSNIKDEFLLISYLIDAFKMGNYYYNSKNSIIFENGLVLPIDSLIPFMDYVLESIIYIENLSNDGKMYLIRDLEINYDEARSKEDVRNVLKAMKIYEYGVVRKDKKALTYNDMQFILKIIKSFGNYNFDIIKKITSKLSTKGYLLSISKKNVVLRVNEKKQAEKLLNENDLEDLIEYLRDFYNCHNADSVKKRSELVEECDILRELCVSYEKHESLDKVRKKHELILKKCQEEIFMFSTFYVYYIYDGEDLKNEFAYERLGLNGLKPTIIDYETEEYKNILEELSSLNKKVVIENRKINRLLGAGSMLNVKEQKEIEKGRSIADSCRDLEKLVKKINNLREELDKEKDSNHHQANINITKVRYISLAIGKGKWKFDKGVFTFDDYSDKDNHHTFHLVISLKELEESLLSFYNKHVRLYYYQF